MTGSQSEQAGAAAGPARQGDATQADATLDGLSVRHARMGASKLKPNTHTQVPGTDPTPLGSPQS